MPSPRATTAEARTAQSPCSATGESLQRKAHVPQLEKSPLSLHLEKSPSSIQDPAQPKVSKQNH